MNQGRNFFGTGPGPHSRGLESKFHTFSNFISFNNLHFGAGKNDLQFGAGRFNEKVQNLKANLINKN
jgi:hypothetical protein